MSPVFNSYLFLLIAGQKLAAKLGLNSVEELEAAIDSMEGIAPDGSQLEGENLAREARVRSAYLSWCKEYGKEPDETRFQQFSTNFLEMEEYANESGKAMALNEYADCSEEEYAALMQGEDAVKEAESAIKAAEGEMKAKEEAGAQAAAAAKAAAKKKAEEEEARKKVAETAAARKAEIEKKKKAAEEEKKQILAEKGEPSRSTGTGTSFKCVHSFFCFFDVFQLVLLPCRKKSAGRRSRNRKVLVNQRKIRNSRRSEWKQQQLLLRP